MRKPNVIIVCTPPCCSVVKTAALYAVQNPEYTAVQYEDILAQTQTKTGLTYSDILNTPQLRQHIEDEFYAFVLSGLDLSENLIITGPTWCVSERQSILRHIPDHYIVTAWSMSQDPEACSNFNHVHRHTDRLWPEQEMTRIQSRFTLPSSCEGFDHIHLMTEDMPFPKTVAA